MSRPAAGSAATSPLRLAGGPLRAAFVGSPVWLDGCLPAASASLQPAAFALSLEGASDLRGELAAFAPHATVVLDPLWLEAELLGDLPGVTVGVLVAGVPALEDHARLEALDRLITFFPALTGEPVGSGRVWRALPPPVSDRHYGEVRELHGAPRVMSLGRSTAYREQMLTPAKHHHDLLQAIHGVHGALLEQLLGEHDVGVYVPPEPGHGFGLQAALHLAAGQLLMSTPLAPAHGLEREIDYLQFDSPEGLVWSLDRLARFPEMHQRVRVRGRMKAEQFRASRLFARLVGDLLADVAAFGRGPAATGAVAPPV
jgi:hypothetical protein